MSAAGVDSPLGELLPLIRSVVSEVDVAGLEVPEAASLVEECAEAERFFATLGVVAAAPLENAGGVAAGRGSGRWRRGWGRPPQRRHDAR